MNKMQKEWIKNMLLILGAIAYGITAIIFAALGEPWHWVSIGMMGLIAVPIGFAAIYIPIATFVWHWRMMGVCITEEDEKLLNQWWFFIKRSECWPEYLREEIQEIEEEELREGAENLRTRLMCVEKPKWI